MSQMIFARERREHPSLPGLGRDDDDDDDLVCYSRQDRHDSPSRLSLSIASVARPEPDLGSPEVGCFGSEGWALRPFCPPFIPWFRDMSSYATSASPSMVKVVG